MNCECLRRMKVVNAEFEQAEPIENPRSGESSKEQLCDEQAWSRMDDEGCPDYPQRGDPRQDVSGMGVEGS